MRLRLYLSERQAGAVQFYESMGLILSAAFGGKKQGSVEVAETKEQIAAAMKAHFEK